MPTAIPLTEEFNDSRGVIWKNYDAYQQIDRTNMAKLKHVDIRTFNNADETAPLTVLNLSTLSMAYLNTQTMTQLQATTSLGQGEAWSGATASQLVGDSYVRSLSITTDGSGNATASSVLNGLGTIDLLTGFADDDHIVLSFPSYATTLTAASCFLDLTSHPTGNFATGPTASAAFSTSITSPTNGSPSELRFLRSQFSSIDLSKVTGVRIRLVGAVSTAYKLIGGIRLLSKNWLYTGIDLDTRYGRLRRTVPRNGNVAAAKDFTWPILWRASEVPGENDPRPIDAEMGVVFNTGTIASSNSVSMYFREVTEDFLTQLDLNGTQQHQLTGKDQPDIGTAKYNSRTQADLDIFNQDQLGVEEQFSLERTPDSFSASWIQVLLQWQSGSGTITFIDTEGNGYSFPTGALSNDTNYMFKARLEENSLRGVIYSLDSVGAVVSKVFDTTTVRDTFAFKRRKGRYGWYADLQDGGAWVDSIRERYTMFAEYRSLPFLSTTPVDGAELFVGASPNRELFSAFGAGPFNTTKTLVERDSERTTTESSWKITQQDTSPLQGIQSNTFLITDFDNARASFDIYVKSEYNSVGDLLPTTFKAFLFNEFNTRWVELVVPEVQRDVWQNIIIDFPYDTVLTGTYKLVLLRLGAATTPWWVDNVSVFQRAVAWRGRAVVDDPWNSNNAQWTPFREIKNRESGGVMFTRRGNQLQISGKALTQFAEIDRIQFKPNYSELGRIPEPPAPYGNKPVGGAVTASFGTSTPGGSPAFTRRFTATATPAQLLGFIVSYEWNFGDGAVGYGQVCDHTYPASATYTVRLVVTDNNGVQGTYTNTVAV